MAPIVKDPENVAAPTAPGIPTGPVSNAAARPQPVALEVPVTVNGSRLVEGSEKREPFSERSQTVLVFGHGAVLRISALLAPGQLVFLTNEKTKKEVICVVVKSKTDGNAVGYVELRFTEPAPGFWGMRFPSDTVLPQAATRPAAPASAPPTAAPVAPRVVAKPVAPPLPISLKPVTPVSPAPPASPVDLQSTPAADAVLSSVASSPLFAPTDTKPVVLSAPSKNSAPANQSTDDLKQQAARLQEQLSSLLFAEAPKPIAATPVATLENTSTQPMPSQPVKSVVPPPKSGPSSLEVEEIKIPSWLAPLARESETQSVSASSSAESNSFAEVQSVVAEIPEERTSPEAREFSRRPEVAIFGGQLLGESSQLTDAAPSGSKMGLFLGIAASLLLIAGGVWYSRQPGNAISSMLGGSSTSSEPAASTPTAPEPEVAKPIKHPDVVVAATSSSPRPAPVNSPAPIVSAAVKNTSAAPASRNANPNASSNPAPNPRATLPVEEPKKPALGDVRLAKPLVNRGKAASAPGESEPSLDVTSNANNAEPLSGLSTSHRNEPTAPVPIGGDVKPAKLIKSVQPVYPAMAKSQHVSGNVQIDALIDADGNVSAMKVLSGPTLLRDAALQSLKQWKYQPAELDGKPTTMHLTVTLQFRAQ